MISENWLNHVNIVANGGKVWFFSELLRCLLEVNLNNVKTKSIVDMSIIDSPFAHRAVLFHDNRLYLLPFRSSELIIFDLSKALKKFHFLRKIIATLQVGYVGEIIYTISSVMVGAQRLLPT